MSFWHVIFLFIDATLFCLLWRVQPAFEQKTQWENWKKNLPRAGGSKTSKVIRCNLAQTENSWCLKFVVLSRIISGTCVIVHGRVVQGQCACLISLHCDAGAEASTQGSAGTLSVLRHEELYTIRDLVHSSVALLKLGVWLLNLA